MSRITASRTGRTGAARRPARGPRTARIARLAEAAGEIEQLLGMNVRIFNPRLDRDGSVARQFVASLVAGLGRQV